MGTGPTSASAKIIFAAENSRTAGNSNGKSPMILARHPGGENGRQEPGQTAGYRLRPATRRKLRLIRDAHWKRKTRAEPRCAAAIHARAASPRVVGSAVSARGRAARGGAARHWRL